MNKNCYENYLKKAQDNDGILLSTEYKTILSYYKFKCKRGHEFTIQGRKVHNHWCNECRLIDIRKYKINDSILKEETEEVFYLAGYWAADGCKRHTEDSGYLCQIELATKDKHILEKFKNILGYTGNITDRTRKCKKSKSGISNISMLKFNSREIYYDFEKFGIIQRKTYTMEIPEYVLNHKYLRHYLRGYIDGDGCFAYAQNKNQRKHITFCMKGTYMFLNQFRDILINENIISKEFRDFIPKEGKQYKVFDKIQLSGNNVILNLYNFLYDNATIFLDRKYQIAKDSLTLARYNKNVKRKTYE